PHDRMASTRPLTGRRPAFKLSAVITVPPVDDAVPIALTRLVILGMRRVRPEGNHVELVEHRPHPGIDLIPRRRPQLATLPRRPLPHSERDNKPVGQTAPDQTRRIVGLRPVEE